MGSCKSMPASRGATTSEDESSDAMSGLSVDGAQTQRVDGEETERESLSRMSQLNSGCFDHVSIKYKTGEGENETTEHADSVTVMFRLGLGDAEDKVEKKLESLWRLQQITRLEFFSFPLFGISEKIGNLTSLERLRITGAARLTNICHTIGSLENLRELCISGCSELSCLPPEIGMLQNLERLEIYGCSALEALPPEICKLQKLKSLELNILGELRSLPDHLGPLKCLETLMIQSCPMVKSLPPSVGELENLEALFVAAGGVSNPVAIEIPLEIRRCKKLKEISLRRLLPRSVRALFSQPWNAGDGSGSRLMVLRVRETGLTDEDCGRILPNLPASLVVMDVAGNRISSLRGFVNRGLPPGIRKLVLTRNPILDSTDMEERSNLSKLLHGYQHLGWMDWRFGIGEIFTPPHLHLLLFNRCGRALMGKSYLDRESYLPASVWPRILEMVWSSADDTRLSSICSDTQAPVAVKAGVVYALLRGPALLERYA